MKGPLMTVTGSHKITFRYASILEYISEIIKYLCCPDYREGKN